MAKGNKRLDSLLYAAFKDDVAFSIRDMKQFLKKGGRLNQEEIAAILDKLYVNLAYEVEDAAIDEDRAIALMDRAEAYLEAAAIKFIEIPMYADVISDEGEDVQIDISEDTITIEGEDYGIISGTDYFALKRAGVQRRGRTITTFNELVDYVQAVPYVYGIEIVYSVTGIIVGYRVWVGKFS